MTKQHLKYNTNPYTHIHSIKLLTKEVNGALQTVPLAPLHEGLV